MFKTNVTVDNNSISTKNRKQKWISGLIDITLAVAITALLWIISDIFM